MTNFTREQEKHISISGQRQMIGTDQFVFCLHPRILCRQGLASKLGPEVTKLGGQRVLLMADAAVQRAGLLTPIEQGLVGYADVVGIFDRIAPQALLSDVTQATAQARNVGADLIIAIGDGPTLDIARYARLLATAESTLPELLDHTVGLPLIAVPVPAGSGSEVSSSISIIDDTVGKRLRLTSVALSPTITVLDPELTRSLPPLLTAATSMQALSNGIEAFVSSRSTPFGDSLALYAIDLIASYLRDATHDPNDMNALSALMIAGTMNGIALDNATRGLVWAMSEAITNSYNVHPGALHGILLPFVMQFNSIVVPNRYQRIARALGVPAGGRAEVDVIGDSVTEVRSLAADCNLPLRLRDVGVPREELAPLAESVAADEVLTDTLRPLGSENLRTLFDEAW